MNKSPHACRSAPALPPEGAAAALGRPGVGRAQRPHACRSAPQRGSSLLVILVVMAVLSFLALGAMNSSVVQERMAGNTRDRQVALQAAEAALRDAERDIEANLTATSPFVADCTGGLCIPPSDAPADAQSAPLWETANWAAARAYGRATGAPALLGPGNEQLASQPRYLVERLPALPPKAGEDACVGGGCTSALIDRARAYRITARASGIRASTVVTLQSVYVKQ